MSTKKPTAAESAEWHRERAHARTLESNRTRESAINHPPGDGAASLHRLADAAATRAAHHEAAAEALEEREQLLALLREARGYIAVDCEDAALLAKIDAALAGEK